MNRENSSTIEANFQTKQNRIVRAAVFVAQSSVLLREESADLLSGRDATRLRELSEGLQQLVPALNRLGRAVGNREFSEPMPPRLDECLTAGSAL